MNSGIQGMLCVSIDIIDYVNGPKSGIGNRSREQYKTYVRTYAHLQSSPAAHFKARPSLVNLLVDGHVKGAWLGFLKQLRDRSRALRVVYSLHHFVLSNSIATRPKTATAAHLISAQL